MLRGHVFSEQVFGVDIFALFINQFLGGNNGIVQPYKNAMEMTNTSNSITVNSGVAVIQGRYLEEHTESIISYAKTDNLYCSLVIEIDLGKTNTRTSLEQARYKILEGENDYPTLIQDDIANQEGNIYQFELARFQNGSTGIINFIDRRSYLSFDSVYSGIIQDNLNSDSSTSALSAKQGKILSGIRGKILWTNPNPNQAFAAQDINLNSNDYDFIEVIFKQGTNTTYRTPSARAPKGSSLSGFQFSVPTNAGNSYACQLERRDVYYINDTKYSVQNCYGKRSNVTTDASTLNEVLIPLYVIGYKTGMFEEV